MAFVAILRIPMMACLAFLLPGYLAQEVVFSRKPKYAAASRWEVLLGAVLASTLWTGGLAVLLLQFGWFSFSLLMACNVGVVAVSAGLAIVLHVPLWGRAKRPSTADWLLLLALVGIAAVYLRPHEFVTGGADAGVYVNLGETISTTGGWLLKEELIAHLPEALYPAFFRQQPPAASTRFLKFPGFYLTNPSAGEITPQFYPLHPTWLAIFNAAGGLRFSLLATPVWGILAGTAVAAVAHQLFGARSGRLSLFLLSFTATQVWFARYPTSEMLTQFLLFGGMWALIRYLRTGSPWYAALAGSALGEVMLVRVDLYFLLALPIALGVWRLLAGRLTRRDLILPGLMGVHLVQSLVFAWTRSRPYVVSVFGPYVTRASRVPPVVLVAFLVVALSSVALVIYHLRWRRRNPLNQAEKLARIWDYSMRVLAVIVVLAAFYAYFVRPRLADPGVSWYYWYGDQEIANVEPYNMVRLGWYLTPLGLALGTLGAYLALKGGVTVDRAVLMGIGLFFTVLFVQSSRNNPHHIYVMRRYVPAVIPFLIMMMAYAIDRLWSVPGRVRFLGPATGVVLSVWLVLSARLEFSHIEYEGFLAQITPQIEALGESAVILFNDDLPVSAGAILGTPLDYLYGHTVFDLQEEFVDPEVLAAQVAVWQSQGLRVLLAEGSHAVPDLLPTVDREPFLDFSATYPILEVSYEHKPREIWNQTMEVRFFEVTGVH
ncbi:MAG: hypothetical protein JXC32_08410 [Anaerolineae bacterium]|nr:hypothetical protein [Anaerolineae bacterium]